MSARVRGERGSASVFVVGMSIVLFICAGLVVDGGLAINARMRVADDAEQASRVGADTIDVEALRATGDISIDPLAARSRAAAYLADRGYGVGQYRVAVQDGTVNVTVEDVTDTTILGLVGIDQYDVRAGATSTPLTGPDAPAAP